MFKERIFIVGEDKEVHTKMEEVSCPPYNLTDADIIHASIVMDLARFIWDYEARLENPGFYAEIPTIEIDVPREPIKLSFRQKLIIWLRKLIPTFPLNLSGQRTS
jgi:hypothetical protein